MSDAPNNGHVPAIGRFADGENCAICRAWSDEDWAKPCPSTRLIDEVGLDYAWAKLRGDEPPTKDDLRVALYAYLTNATQSPGR